MPIDNKYGYITAEFGDLGVEEPVFIFRGRDKLLPKVLAYYHLFCLKAGSPRKHLDLIMDSHDKIKHWQENEGSLSTRLPISQNYQPSEDSLEHRTNEVLKMLATLDHFDVHRLRDDIIDVLEGNK